MSKVNDKYGVYGLTKENDVTTLLGHGINDYPETTRTHLANYGMFVEASRTHAATKECPLTEQEKKDRFIEIDKWFMAGCPKREKVVMTAKEKEMKRRDEVAQTMRSAVEKGTKAEKAMVEKIIIDMTSKPLPE
jgi:hypothetical protein